MATKTASTFATHYQQLREAVEKLRRTDVANIDNLVEIVKQATVAHDGCQERLEAIKGLVEGELGKSPGEGEQEILASKV